MNVIGALKKYNLFRGTTKDFIRSFRFVAAQIKPVLSFVFEERREIHYQNTVGKGFIICSFIQQIFSEHFYVLGTVLGTSRE